MRTSNELKAHDEAQVDQDQVLRNRGQAASSVPASASVSSPAKQSLDYDPLEAAMQRHPGLTEEKAEEIAKAFGF